MKKSTTQTVFLSSSEDGELLQRLITSVNKCYGLWSRSGKIAGKKSCWNAAVIIPVRRLPLTPRIVAKIFERK